ncbi:MAG: hypothetical protein JST40_12480 [Armatimonadetes bacterium]|nr:hypothetical protein [Armatimonadota bacterium]
MRLKIVTTILLILGVALLVAWPFVVGAPPPAGTDRHIVARYGMKLLLYFAATAFTFLGTAVCAIFVARNTKVEYLESQQGILKELIEGTLRDHERHG